MPAEKDEVLELRKSDDGCSLLTVLLKLEDRGFGVLAKELQLLMDVDHR
jgi:hypothetical protein